MAAGTLQLGNGGTTGSIIGPVINNGALIINRSNAYSLTGPISGTGLFTPPHSISNDELVAAFNAYVERFNAANAEAIYRNPQHEYTRKLLGSIPRGFTGTASSLHHQAG